jgi:hypothetical protein
MGCLINFMSWPLEFIISQLLNNQTNANKNQSTLLRVARGQTGKGANLCRRAEQSKVQVGFSGLLFFGSFLLEEQKNRLKGARRSQMNIIIKIKRVLF